MTTTTFVSGTVIEADWLNDVNDHVYDEESTAHSGSKISFLQSGTGASTRTIQDKLRDVVSVKDFGAVGDGTTDDTSAMQAAHNTGRPVFYPKGNYKFTTITIGAGGIIGEGPGNTILRSTNTTTADLITFTGQYLDLDGVNPANIGLFRDFTVSVPSGAKSDGAGLKLQTASPTTTYSSMHVIDNVVTNYTPIGIHFANHEFGRVSNSTFRGYTVAGIKLENSYNADMGDPSVTDCVFVTNPTSSACRAIWMLSSGGLKVKGCKILGGQYGISVEYTAANATSNLIVVGNSIELPFVAAIQLTRTSGTQTFKNIVISSNQIALTPAGIVTDSSGFLSDIVITDNDFNLNSNGSYPNTICVSMNAVDTAVIAGNIMRGNASGTRTGISLVNCTAIKIGTNAYQVDDAITTSSSTWSVTKETQQANIILGTTPGTSTSGYVSYGALYLSALQTVTWADLGLRNLKETPSLADITFTPSTANGTVAGIVISASTTGMTFYAVTNSSGLAAWLAVSVAGVL